MKYVILGLVAVFSVILLNSISFSNKETEIDLRVYNDCIKYEFSDEADWLGDGFVPGLIEKDSEECVKIANCYAKYKTNEKNEKYSLKSGDVYEDFQTFEKKMFYLGQKHGHNSIEAAQPCIRQVIEEVGANWERKKKPAMTYLEAGMYDWCIRFSVDLKSELTPEVVEEKSRQCDKFAECVDATYFHPVTDAEAKRNIEIEKTKAGRKSLNIKKEDKVSCAEKYGLTEFAKEIANEK